MSDMSFEVWVNMFYEQILITKNGKMIVRYKDKTSGDIYTINELSIKYGKRL